jgi:hypothetical protein
VEKRGKKGERVYNFMGTVRRVEASKETKAELETAGFGVNRVAWDELLVPGKQLGTVPAHQDQDRGGNPLVIPPLQKELG